MAHETLDHRSGVAVASSYSEEAEHEICLTQPPVVEQVGQISSEIGQPEVVQHAKLEQWGDAARGLPVVQ